MTHRLTPRILVMYLVAVFVIGGCSREQHASWTTSSGLQITELVVGEGDLPRQGDVLGVVYTASYVDGNKVFDSYTDRETPYHFRLGMHQVLPGLDEGCSTMRKGGKRILVLPPHLAFEAESEGRPTIVPENAWVRFEVELIEVIESLPTPDPWNDAGMEMYATDTGLQFVDFIIGEGEAPTLGTIVVVHYSGFLDDGTLFDTTYLRGMPLAFTFDEEHLIPGWLEGLASMREGGRRKIIVPPYLAYGEKGFQKAIPPHATLTFDIELLEVRPAESAQ